MQFSMMRRISYQSKKAKARLYKRRNPLGNITASDH
jgi:hypothetical protein